MPNLALFGSMRRHYDLLASVSAGPVLALGPTQCRFCDLQSIIGRGGLQGVTEWLEKFTPTKDAWARFLEAYV
jgi:hypothetical protein